MTPLLDPPTLELPLTVVIVVGDPKLTAVPVLLVTVGLFEPIVAAPPNVRLLSPAYPVAVFPNASLAVSVRLSAAPAVGLVDAAASTSRVAVAGLTVMPDCVPAIVAFAVSVAVIVLVTWTAVFKVKPF